MQKILALLLMVTFIVFPTSAWIIGDDPDIYYNAITGSNITALSLASMNSYCVAEYGGGSGLYENTVEVFYDLDPLQSHFQTKGSTIQAYQTFNGNDIVAVIQFNCIGHTSTTHVPVEYWRTGSLNFTASVREGTVPFSSTFTTINGTVSTLEGGTFEWLFGDGGTNTSTLSSTPHSYTIAGNYTPVMIFHTNLADYTVSKSDYIWANPSPANTITYFQCVDGQDSSSIYGCDISIKDETYNYWANSTADADGTHFIVSNTTDTLAGYATATGFQSTSRTGLAAWSEGLYELIMWPDDSVCTTPGKCGTAYDPGTGNVNLIIMVNDKDTSDPIADAEIKLVEDVGATTYGTTNEAGTEMFFFSNKTQVRSDTTKGGYTSASKIYMTSDFGPDTVRLELSKSYVTVTPTVTITDGSGNPVETIDTRTASEQDQALFDKLRKEAPTLIDLCILAITVFILMSILAEFGVKFK